MDAEFVERFETAVREDGRYAPEAFEFLHRGLELATRIKFGRPTTAPPTGGTSRPGSVGQHVTGQELAQALRILALQMWGPLAREVLNRWGIRCTRDFGEMVYLMINLKLMGKQDSDDIGDFDDVYDFATAFREYEIPLDAESIGEKAD